MGYKAFVIRGNDWLRLIFILFFAWLEGALQKVSYSWVTVTNDWVRKLYMYTSVVFIAARISYFRFFTVVHVYVFRLYTIIIHHLDGLFGPNIMTSSQLSTVGLLAQLVERFTGIAQVMGSNPVRTWILFSGLISFTSSVVFIAAKISYIPLWFYC